MLVSALRAEAVEGRLQLQEVISVRPAGSMALVDMLGQLLRVLGPDKLVVFWGADVH